MGDVVLLCRLIVFSCLWKWKEFLLLLLLEAFFGWNFLRIFESSGWICVYLCACLFPCCRAPSASLWAGAECFSPACFPLHMACTAAVQCWPVVAGLHRGQPAASQHCWPLTWLSCWGIFLGLAQQLGDFWHEKPCSGDLPTPARAVKFPWRCRHEELLLCLVLEITFLVWNTSGAVAVPSLWEQMLQWSVAVSGRCRVNSLRQQCEKMCLNWCA